MNQITVQVPAFPTRAPRGASLVAELAVFVWRGLASIGEWFRQAREAETRMSHY
jgi:hypothetical protein